MHLESNINKELKSRSKEITEILLLCGTALWFLWIGFDYFFAPELLGQFIVIRVLFAAFFILSYFGSKRGKISDTALQLCFLIPPILTVSYMFNIVPESSIFAYFLGGTMVAVVSYALLILDFRVSLISIILVFILPIIFYLFLGKHSGVTLLKNGGFVYASIAIFGFAFSIIRYKSFRKNIETEIKLSISNEELKESLKERELLLKEVHHRVKNNLQIVNSLLSLQEDMSSKKTTEQVLSASKSRIESMAIIHECLYENDSLSRIEIHSYLSKISSYLLDNLSKNEIDLVIEGDDFQLNLEQVVPCGLIVNEVITNALKHAFITSTNNRITIKTSLLEADYASIEISDNGIGIDQFSENENLGFKLIRGLSNQLKAALTIDGKKGTSISFKFNLKNG